MVQMQGLPGGADQLPHYGQHPSGGVGMAGAGLPGGAQAQLEALLGVDSQLGLGNGVASDVGAGTWSSGRGLPAPGLTSSQVGAPPGVRVAHFTRVAPGFPSSPILWGHEFMTGQ
jgi:hypothetical protein